MNSHGASVPPVAERGLRDISEPRHVRVLPSSGLLDQRGRRLRDLRISVTDRCNFRCVYCMPKEIFGRDYQFRERDELLTFEEITRLVTVAMSLGVRKVRLTGGEPLLRRGIEELISQLAGLHTPGGERLNLALTTNGSALPVKAAALKAAGLDRVTISLDSLNEAKFQAINDVKFPVARVLEAIRVADEVGLAPVKINTVLKRGVNDDEIVALAARFKHTPHPLRFIEFMDVGATNGWILDDVVPSAEVIDTISRVYPLVPAAPTQLGETAKRWRYADGSPGEIGVISSVTQAFCGTCNRARISAEGRLFTCLFSSEGTDLRSLLRGGASYRELSDVLAGIWSARDDRYSEIRSELTDPQSIRAGRIEMSYIGG